MPRILASSAFALALLLPALAFADPDGGTSSTDAGTGGASTSNDPSCTIATQSIDGTSCADCQITGSDTSCSVELGADYNYVCNQSPTVEIWCNGPPRYTAPDPSCALHGAPLPAGGAALAALLGLVAARLRRRR